MLVNGGTGSSSFMALFFLFLLNIWHLVLLNYSLYFLMISGLNVSDTQKRNGEDELNPFSGATYDAKAVSMLNRSFWSLVVFESHGYINLLLISLFC